MRRSLWLLILAALALMPVAAMARPRDEAMSGAFRCASLGASRMWLDCYYGAAQPVRAALGLAPAPAAQVQLARTAPATASGPIEAGAIRDQVMGAAFGCNGLPGEREWLNCYYAAAQPMRTQLGLAPASQPGPQKQASRVPPPRLVAPSGSTAGDTRIRLAAYSFDRHGMFTVTLANGQVFQQRADDVNYAHWKGPASGHVVSVSGGAFGHWQLEDERDHTVYEVQPAR